VRGDNLEHYYSAYVGKGSKQPKSGAERTTARSASVDQAAGGPPAAGTPRASNAVDGSNRPRTSKR
jgi:hypothetical protein